MVYNILTRKEAAEIANVTVAAITVAANRGDLTVATVDRDECRKNGLFIINDELFYEYCEHIKNSNHKKSGRRCLEM
jgi:hypothetical protein